MELRDQLARQRQELHLSQRELAILANRATSDQPHISASAICRIESGEHQPSLASLIALAAGLDVLITISQSGILLVQMGG